ncbi:MAG: PorV/PorQ family protein [Saprospirales bacterium]|nr:PorV/PorQ family protein [Saprospirales bacterium]
MTRLLYILLLGFLLAVPAAQVEAGNPDRQGEGGAPQLLMNPWARSAGLHSMTTSSVFGVEAMRINIAGLGRINKTQFMASHAIYLEGTGVSMNAFGMAQKLGKGGALGVSIMALDFGDIPVTTNEQPEGTGATFSPRFFNIGLGYSYTFENRVSVGVLFRNVSESIADLSGSALGIDAGVQYVTGAHDNFKFGISLRNIGGRMQYKGEGLSFNAAIPLGSGSYDLASNRRAASFELPSMLNIGLSYDFLFGSKGRLTAVGNFTSNAFAQDQIGGGIEFAFNEMFMVRGGYRLDFGATSQDTPANSLYSGLCGGVTLDVPIKKEDPNGTRFGIDYGYRAANIFGGTHNVSIRLNL